MTDYADADWLRERIRAVLDFYYPACIDEEHGGFVAQLDYETGEVYDADSKHLVATARFTRNFALASELFGDERWFEAAERGVEFLHGEFRDAERGGYHWLLEGTTPAESRRICYGHAFVVLAYARAAEAGVPNAETYLDEVWELLDDRFYEPDHGLYRSAYDADWTEAEPYRGQNANMHACEASLVAHEVTGEGRYLDRAATIAESLCVDLAAATDGRVWEHYDADWTQDFAYNRDEPAHQFRPWGYQPGHHAEWAKLLSVLDRHHDAEWPRERATELFETALDGWDDDRGGFYYSLDEDGDPVVDDKYSWEVAEAIGAAAALAERTGDERYREWYDRFWTYALDTMVAPAGNWYERVDADNEVYPTGDGPEVEPGYHPIGACYEGLRSLGE
ncbi:AGE family epimerase/isomerase [Halomicroarcula limicola]|uniref:AGE family epimerase/isomerase n=1 Tax=Haloarcula limicola TaxID=1429915 RepID=A0A8J7YBS9_9EURY|nr:AGE family epimerase/isomerase [Halomicroarcula limicola]MBV0925578.1 AGE family epimerase/isomerase [Halomicroarcula limicola]